MVKLREDRMKSQNVWAIGFSILAALLCTLGGDGNFYRNFLYAVTVMLVGVFTSSMLWKTSLPRQSFLYMVDAALMLSIAFILWTTDAKDRPILLVLFLLAILTSLLQHVISKNRYPAIPYIQVLTSWLIWLSLILVSDRISLVWLQRCDVNVDIFHLLISAALWQILAGWMLRPNIHAKA